MAYLAFYRLFRPSTFAEVVRQEHIVKILTNQIEENKVGHAYLFCGPRGTGKTSVAKIFARAVNCEHPVNGSPCGKCPVCRALADPSNLDVMEIDAASNNGVAEMRDLREKVQYPPVAGKYKVYIVDEVHMLSDSAFNAMLKTLEEPPRHAIFILATTEPHKLPATILSRCMRFDFKLLPEADLEALLRTVFEKIGKEYEEEALSAIARAGAGSARDTLSIADTCVSYDKGKLTYEGVEAVLGNADFTMVAKLVREMLTGEDALSTAERFLAEGKDVGVLCKDILQTLNRVSIAKLCRDAKSLLSLPDYLFRMLEDIAKKADGHRILRASELFASLEGQLRYASSPRILLETTVIKASMPETDYHVDSLLARVAALEETIARGVFADRTDARRETEGRAEQPRRQIVDEEAPPAEFFEIGEPPLGQAERAPIAVEERSAPPAKEIPPSLDPKKEPARRISPAGDNKTNAFGKFLRALRRLGRGGTGVLVTMCTQCESRFEGDTFVLYTDNEVIYHTAIREDNALLIKEALAQIGIDDYRILLAGGKESDPLEQFEKDFQDQKIIKK